MLIKKYSPITGKENEMEIPTTPEKIAAWSMQSRDIRRPIQEVFPELTADQREFLLTGITPEEWDRMFAH